MPPPPPFDPPGGRTQEARGLEALLSPRSVAVIGASPTPGTVGHALLASILQGGFTGPVVPIHPKAKDILGHPCYPSIDKAPLVPDLAVIAVPAAAVNPVAEACGRRGVKSLLVISAGFRESDEAGAQRERELVAIVRRHGMRMVGPNCLGIINNDPAIRLQATFAPRDVPPGSAAMVSQSGAVGIAILEQAAHAGFGLARFVSMGNKPDVSGNDLLLLWENDPAVRQVLLYLENFGNPRNFVQIARRMTRTKPILVVKSGRTATGAVAAGSHTGAMMQSDALVDALLEQCGVQRADSVEEMFQLAAAFDSQQPLAGPRIAIVTNSGGPAIMAVDRLETSGLRLATPRPATWTSLAAHIPAASHPANPLDLLAGGTPEAFAAAIAAFDADPEIDGILAVWTPLGHGHEAQARAIATALAAARKPGLAVTFGHGPATPAFEAVRGARVPVYAFPEPAVRSFAALRRLGEWRARPEEKPSQPAVDRATAAAIVHAARAQGGGWLSMKDAFAVVAAYGIRVPRHAWVDDAAAAGRAAERLGPSVALKFDAPGLVHKTEAGAVRLALAGSAAVEAAYRDMQNAMALRGHRAGVAVVMEMVEPAPEVLVGGTQDPTFGPVIACGTGGIYTEILHDVRFRLAPIAKGEAQRMVERLRSAPILAGARGAKPADVAALVDMVERVSALVGDHPEILEVEVNPVRVLPQGQGAVAVDVRVRVSTPREGAAGPQRNDSNPQLRQGHSHG